MLHRQKDGKSNRYILYFLHAFALFAVTMLCVSCGSTEQTAKNAESETTQIEEPKTTPLPQSVRTAFNTNCTTYEEFVAKLPGIPSSNDSNASQTLGSQAQNDMKWREEWKAIWNTFRRFSKENWAYISCNSADLQTLSVNYNNGTANYVLPARFKLNPDCTTLYRELLNAYNRVPKLGDWGLYTDFWFSVNREQLKGLIASGYFADPFGRTRVMLDDFYIADFGGGSYMQIPDIDAICEITATLKTSDGKAIASDTLRKRRPMQEEKDDEVYGHYLSFPSSTQDFMRETEYTVRFVFHNVSVDKMDGKTRVEIKPNCTGGVVVVK